MGTQTFLLGCSYNHCFSPFTTLSHIGQPCVVSYCHESCPGNPGLYPFLPALPTSSAFPQPEHLHHGCWAPASLQSEPQPLKGQQERPAWGEGREGSRFLPVQGD